MSYSGTAAGAGAAAAAARESVEEFVYQAPGSAGLNAPGSAGLVAGQPDNLPRISEQELSRLLSEARAEGFREGEKQARKTFEESLAEQRRLVNDALLAFQQERTNYYSNVEVQLVHLSLAIAGKILHREAQVDRMVVAGLVKVMLERMQQGTTAIVRIRPEDAFSWRHYFNTNPNVEILEDPTLEPNACRIETELGIAEMGLDAQLKEVENGFFDLLAQRPDVK
ncbi:MAG: FliH/SctL family protein [Terriglobales bacterium]|jgi:flagellar assembly protein FliH